METWRKIVNMCIEYVLMYSAERDRRRDSPFRELEEAVLEICREVLKKEPHVLN